VRHQHSSPDHAPPPQVRQEGAERWRRLQMVCLTDTARPEFLALQELHERQLTLIEGSALWEPDLLGRAALPRVGRARRRAAATVADCMRRAARGAWARG
jgi:hypothetical protein